MKLCSGVLVLVLVLVFRTHPPMKFYTLTNYIPFL